MALYHNQFGAQPILVELSEIIGSLSTPGKDSFPVFLRRACELLNASAGCINRVSKINYTVEYHVDLLEPTRDLTGDQGSSSGCICLKTLENTSIYTDLDFPKLRVNPYYAALDWHGYLGYPLVVNNVRIGTLTFFTKSRTDLLAQQIADRKLIVQLLGQAVQNKMLLESLNSKILDYHEELENSLENYDPISNMGLENEIDKAEKSKRSE